MRSDEKSARDAFSRFLAARHGEPGRWAPGADPPDWDLVVSERRYAVEVTQVVEKYQYGPRPLSQHGAIAGLENFLRTVEHEAATVPTRNGFYLIRMCPVPGFKELRPVLRERILKYFDDTAGNSRAPKQVIFGSVPENHWVIEKIEGGALGLSWSIAFGGARMQGEYGRQLRDLVGERVAAKSEFATSSADPAILLLVDSFHYGDRPDWKHAVKAAGPHGFHTIARVYEQRRCEVLYSRSTDWRAAG